MFGPFTFKTETDVRECIIRPMLVALGHPPETIKTGLFLKYQRGFIGRKKPNKDPLIRGAADYVVEVDERLRIVIEAKAPGAINDDEREQAYSYAVHAQVGAVMFVVISGTDFEIWESVAKPGKGLILAFKYDEIESQWTTIKNILTPDSIRLKFPKYELDVGEPLASGLRSNARVESGTQSYIEVPPWLASAQELTIHFSEGSLTRTATGTILLLLRPSHPYKVMTEFQKTLVEVLELESAARTISIDPNSPTIFTSYLENVIKKGTPVPSPIVLNQSVLAVSDITVRVNVEMGAYISGNKFIGDLIARSTTTEGHPFQIRTHMELILR